MRLPPPIATLFPYTTLFRSKGSLFITLVGSFNTTHIEDQHHKFGTLIPLIFTQTTAFPRKAVVFYVRQLKERSEEHTSELQSRGHLVCRLLLEKKKQIQTI